MWVCGSLYGSFAAQGPDEIGRFREQNSFEAGDAALFACGDFVVVVGVWLDASTAQDVTLVYLGPVVFIVRPLLFDEVPDKASGRVGAFCQDMV